MANITPIADRVVIEPVAAAEKTAGGIIIPDAAKEKPKKGTVIATGNPKLNFTVKPGDTVIYGGYTGTEVTVEGKDYLIMKESEILAIV